MAMPDLTLGLALLAGVGIAAACGLRAFLPLLGLGLAARMGWVDLDPMAAWISSDLALWALGCAAVVEIAADKIPIVDHALDVVATVLRPAAAALGGYALLQALPSPWSQIAALGFGGVALAIHGLKANLRLGSTAVTLGHANPVLSAGEDAVSLGTVVMALLAPLIAFLIVLLMVVALVAWTIGRRSASAAKLPAG